MTDIDDGQVRVTEQPDGTDLIWLPDVAYLDTQAGPVELGIDRDITEQLFHALGAHLAGEELTRDEAIALSDDLGQQLYRAQDRVAFVREMLTDRTGTVDVTDVLAWLDHQHCPRVESEQQQIARLTAKLAAFSALADQLEANPGVGGHWDANMGAADAIREILDGPTPPPARTTPDNPLTSTNTVDNPAAAPHHPEGLAVYSTTRYLCPLACGWHHDEPQLPNLTGLAGDSIEELVQAGFIRQARRVELTLRAHLTDHTLDDWFPALVAAQRERDRLAAELEQLRPTGRRITSHAFEGTPGSGSRCKAEAFGETCGGLWERHEMRPDPAP